jgi:hypothetical protein
MFLHTAGTCLIKPVIEKCRKQIDYVIATLWNL